MIERGASSHPCRRFRIHTLLARKCWPRHFFRKNKRNILYYQCGTTFEHVYYNDAKHSGYAKLTHFWTGHSTDLIFSIYFARKT